jgi:hypothetical protein
MNRWKYIYSRIDTEKKRTRKEKEVFVLRGRKEKKCSSRNIIDGASSTLAMGQRVAVMGLLLLEPLQICSHPARLLAAAFKLVPHCHGREPEVQAALYRGDSVTHLLKKQARRLRWAIGLV